VRVHSGASADKAAEAASAEAFAQGSDLYFRSGRFDPATADGQKLLAHELAHTLQPPGTIHRQDDGGVRDGEIPDGGTPEIPDGGVLDAGVRDTGPADAGASGAGATSTSTLPASYDPCAVEVANLDNRALLQYYQDVSSYIDRLNQAGRQGEERFYDYANLGRRLDAERDRRAHAGHVWLNANLTDVPRTLWRLEPSLLGSTISVTPADLSAETSNGELHNAIVLTQGQFDEMLSRENIPMVSPEDFFAQQDPSGPQQPLEIPAPVRTAPTMVLPGTSPLISLPGTGFDPWSAGPLGALGAGYPSPFAAQVFDPLVQPIVGAAPFGLGPQQIGGGFQSDWRSEGSYPGAGTNPWSAGPWGAAGSGYVSPTTARVYQPFARPVVTAGPFGFGPEQIGGFQTDWRGDIGEARFMAQDLETLRAMQDLNLVQDNFPLYDVLDPRMPRLVSIKTQLPSTPGGTPSFDTVQEAARDLFGGGAPARRASALALLQANVDPTLTLDRMLLMTEIAVNEENVAAVQDSLENAIRGGRGQMAYEPLLSAMMRQQPVSIQMRDGSTRVYGDFGSLHADFQANLMTNARYRAAVATLAQGARSRIVSNASEAEAQLRPLLDYRQQYDFTGASEFSGIPDTAPARRAARLLQERYFRRIAVPELMEIQTSGMSPVLTRAGMTGAGLGAGTTAVLSLPHMVDTWDADPYAGRRYLSHVALSGIGGGGQAVADQALRMYISQAGLDLAAARAAAGQSIAPIASLTPLARFGGSTALGGIFSGGLTIGGMYLDERYFGARYTRIDYEARGTRAFVSGSVAAGAGALGTAGTMALLGAEGGGGTCTLVLPGVGTVACGAVGAVGGFIVGLGAYYLFDYTVGERIEGGVREALGERGCTGGPPVAGSGTASPTEIPDGGAPSAGVPTDAGVSPDDMGAGHE
jgi:hypothetical protein